MGAHYGHFARRVGRWFVSVSRLNLAWRCRECNRWYEDCECDDE